MEIWFEILRCLYPVLRSLPRSDACGLKRVDVREVPAGLPRWMLLAGSGGATFSTWLEYEDEPL